jgi:cysteine synthase
LKRPSPRGPMDVKPSVIEAIGNTPLIRLRRASDETGCEILGKAEFLNPGQSVKDRPARQMVLAAEERGELRPGGLIVEGTAGNTGIGLALVASARGYRTIIVIPDTQSQEKKDLLRLSGATLIEVPAVPYANPNNYQHVARRLADQLREREPNGVLFADQWNNLENRRAHYLTTGPEIFRQTGGAVDAFICSVGTGGTLAGVTTYLREAKPGIVIGCADPEGAAMFSLFSTGEAKPSKGSSIAEGIGLGRSTPIVGDIAVEHPYIVPDTEGVACGLRSGPARGPGARRLVRHQHRRRHPPRPRPRPRQDHRHHPRDLGTRYQSKLFNPEFLREHNLPTPPWLDGAEAIDVPFV